jgi:hypothetical protein
MSSVLITSDEYDYFCAMQWQPIETAPKDGTHILAWFDEAQQHLLLWWFADNWRFKGSDTIPIVTPTHWMSLPKPPEEKE